VEELAARRRIRAGVDQDGDPGQADERGAGADADDPAKARYLDPSALDTPALAIGNAPATV